MHERRGRRGFTVFLAVVLTAIFFLFSACAKNRSVIKTDPSTEPIGDGFSVHFIDVGEGDATVVRFPDGKTLMFDVGPATSKAYNRIKTVLSELKTEKIDFLILSHPDEEHIGNLNNILTDYSVGKVYMPKILFPENYPEFSAIYEKFSESEIVSPKRYDYISGEDYVAAFLSPDVRGDLYASFTAKEDPTDAEKDDVSPIIYIEYKGVRFILTADAGKEAESILVNAYNSSAMTTVFGSLGIELKLEDVDFYKISSHGDRSANSTKLLELISPACTVISVGGDNAKGHPSSTVLNGLRAVNEDMKIYRTDYFGTVSVFVNGDGETLITTER